jgi:hypothetical protein
MTHAEQVRSDLGTGEVNLSGGGFSLHLYEPVISYTEREDNRTKK